MCSFGSMDFISGVIFKISDKRPHPFYMIVPPRFELVSAGYKPGISF